MMKKQMFQMAWLVCLLGFTVHANGQSRQTEKMYNHYQTHDGVVVGSVSKDMVGIAVALMKNNESVKNILDDITSIKTIIPQKNGNINDIEAWLPGKKMEIEVKGLNKPLTIFIKRGLWRVKEAHLLYKIGKQPMVISVFGNFKTKDLKAVNENFLQMGGLSKIPMLFSF